MPTSPSRRRRPASRSAVREHRLRVPGRTARHEGQDPAHEVQQEPREQALESVDRVGTAMQETTECVGQRHRTLIGQPRKRFGGTHRLELMRGDGGAQLDDLDRQQAVRPAAAADREKVLQVLDRGSRSQRGEGVLQLVHADHLGKVATDKGDAVVRGHFALPGVRLDLQRLAERRRHAALADARVLFPHGGRRWQLVHAAAAHDHRGRRSQLGDRQLPAVDRHGDDAHPGAAGNAELAARVVEAPVGVGQGLRQHDERAGREVVVVIVLERLERCGSGPRQRGSAAAELRQHEEAALAACLCPDRRLVEADDVAGVAWTLLGDEHSDSCCEAVAHLTWRSLGTGWQRNSRPIIGSTPLPNDQPIRPAGAAQWSPPAFPACAG